MNVVQCLSHSIEERDMLDLYTRIGVDVFSIGGYIDPAHPHDPKRDAVDAPFHPELKAAVDVLNQPDNLGAAQTQLPAAVLDWADVIVYHHNLWRLFEQWPRIRRWLDEDSAHRVIWRSVGQSASGNEQDAEPFMRDGLERVLYSPKERHIPGFSGDLGPVVNVRDPRFWTGQGAPVIRFGKDPAEWYGWTGNDPRVLNISQHDQVPHARDEWLNWGFWEASTAELPRVFAGPNSEKVGGLGTLPLDEMKALLRSCRVYLYTGTQPASYTLGLIEAMMTGIPVLSIGPKNMTIFPYGPSLFEGHELAMDFHNSPGAMAFALEEALRTDGGRFSDLQREYAIETFGIDAIADQWAAYLGIKVPA